MALSALALITALHSSNLASSAQLATYQQQSIEAATVVTFHSPEQARAAAIGLHHLLLAGDWKSGQLILQLDEAEQQKLRPFATSMAPATEWQQQQLQIWQAQQTAQQQAIDVTSQGIPGYSCYETVEETYAAAQQLVTNYPQYATFQSIGSAWAKSKGRDGFDLYVLKITKNNGKTDKPKLLINSAIHAREYTTAATALQFARELLSNTGKDADVDWMLEQNEVHLVLHTNPEGRKIAETGVSWRKNINDQQCASSTYGVDLNRNFSFGWNNVPNDGGSSSNSCNITYRGSTAGSEPEVKALEAYARKLFADKRGPARTDAAPADTSGIHIDLHSYSELVLWPWGEDERVAPNGTALQTLGRKFAYFSDYTPTQSVGLYPTDGTSDGASYGELGVAAFTFEMGTAFFQSCSVFQEDILPRNLPALRYALRVVKAPYLLPAGPDVVGLPSTDLTVAKNRQITVNFNVSDQRFNQLKGVEQTHNIRQVELYIDQLPTDVGATPKLLTAKDGQFDSANEAIALTLDGADLSLGRHTLYWQAKDANNQTGPIYAKYIDVVAPVARKLGFTKQCQFLKCSFTDATEKLGNETLSYRWDFGGGQTSTSNNPQVTFAAAGSYPVKLQVSDGVETTELTQQVQVFAEPSAAITVSCTNLTCSFKGTASSVNGAIGQFAWTINSTSYSGAEQSVTFPQTGTYPVELRVVDSAQQQKTVSESVTVTAGPVVVPPTPTPIPTESKKSGGAVHYLMLLLLPLGLLRRLRR